MKDIIYLVRKNKLKQAKLLLECEIIYGETRYENT
jgi:hypothetical protein